MFEPPMSIQATTSTNEGSVQSGSLREAIEIKRVRGETFTLKETVSIVVPLCTHLAALHESGQRFFVHPTALVYGPAGTELDLALAAALPSHTRDRAVIAPECRKGEKGDLRASIFSVGAIVYELVTGESVGPGMRRPAEVNKALPAQLEVVLGKALVADPKHRPHDLGALAQALHHLAPSGSMPPPPADESHLDHEADFDVDVSLSMIPPPPNMPSGAGAARVAQASAEAPPPSSKSARAMVDPFAAIDAPAAARRPNADDPTVRLGVLKERLESDPRPRYVVVKDGMDHGPFTAVELLQQIASHTFVSDHVLRDSLSGDEKKIEEWSDFALFSQQAHLNREIKQERKALEQVVHEEQHRTRWKVLIGASFLALIVAAGAGWWLRQRARQQAELALRQENASAVDADGALSAGKDDKKPGGGGVSGGGGGGKYPQVAGGGSCESARAKYVEDYSQQGVPPDLGAGSFSNLNSGTYLNSCGVPSNMSVSICAAIQNGRAVGVTVNTKPANAGIAGCVRSAVMGMGFPAHPRMDITTTTFAAQ